jgi:hypothetical protein
MRFLVTIVMAAVLAVAEPAVSTEIISFKGASLIDYLNTINEQGLKVIYSTDLVKEEYRLNEEPNTGDPEASLTAVLSAFGLGIRDGPGDSLLVVRATVTQQPLQPKLEDVALPEIVVSSSLHRLENISTDTHAYLDRELATAVPGTAEEMVRITNRIPGTASGGISTRNHVRGGEPNEVLFLFDGLRMYEPFHMKDFQSIATTVNSRAIAGIDFYTGAYPARFGDRMSGVMSMSLREPEKRRATELALSFFNASLLSIGRFGNQQQGDWLVTARRGNLDLVFDIIDPEFGSPKYDDILAHGGWEFGPRSVFSANYLLSHDRITLNDAGRGEIATASYTNEVAWVKWIADWNGALGSETILSSSKINDRRSGELDLPGVVAGVLDDRREFEIVGLKQDWTYSSSERWMLRFGLDAKHLDGSYRFSSTQFVASPFDTLFDNQPLTIRNSELVADGAQFAGYAELRWQLMGRLALDMGLRWDHQGYTVGESDEQTSPRIGVLYQLGSKTEIRLGWGQFSQAQEVNELQLADGIEDYFPAQRAEHFIANLQHRFDDGIKLDLSLYRKSFRKLRPRFENAFNSLTLLPEIQFDRVQINGDSANSRGAEILLSQQSNDTNLGWWLGYAWAEVYDSTASGRILRSWDQTHAGKAGLSWRWRQWNFSIAGEIHSGWPKTELLADYLPAPGTTEQLVLTTTPLNSDRYSLYHTLDARISRDFNVRRGTLSVSLDITNTFNQKNACCTEYSVDTGAGDAIELVSKEAYWLPLLPSLGVVWRF